MRVTVDLTDLPPGLAVADPEEFGALDVAVVLPEHVWLTPELLASLAGRSDDQDWLDRLAAMTAYAASRGWTDDRGRVRAHVVVDPVGSAG